MYSPVLFVEKPLLLGLLSFGMRLEPGRQIRLTEYASQLNVARSVQAESLYVQYEVLAPTLAGNLSKSPPTAIFVAAVCKEAHPEV